MRVLPYGTVTFLFTDVEGSTKLLHELGSEGYARALGDHRRVLRQAFASHGGVEVDTQGDAFFVAFPTAAGALKAAEQATVALASGPIQVRMGLHTGTPHLTDEGYVGEDVHRAARVAAAGHGGQVLVSHATVARVDSSGLRELGEHRLKDFDAPVSLYQLGAGEFPPLKTVSNMNLPRPASSFVGRERAVADLGSLLQGDARLVTLTGPGGTGKTRLAIEAATELVPEFKAGVFWVGLAALRDPALVGESIARTLGAKDGLEEHIGERELLLVLDNLEQVVEAAPQLAALVERCPNLRLLVTSRELLRVRGETEYPVSPLEEREAVELFCARTRGEPDDAVRELCRALDNLPLAVELAAARARVLSPVQILERLSQRLDLLKGGRDADPRQQTLRATVEWSYELLDNDEQQLFARLSSFRGGCRLEAAEEVADADLDVLQSLVDKSLLRRTDQRFWMLETIREYATERLAESGGAALMGDRHLEHFLLLAERAYEERYTSQSTWLRALAAEHDNIRAAFDWARAGRAEAEARLAGAVALFWRLQGRWSELRARLVGALERYEARDRIRARALTELAVSEDPGATALVHIEEALALWRDESDGRGEGLALEALGLIHLYSGEYEQAQRAFEESLTLRHRAGVPEVEGASALAGLCQLHVAAGRVDRVEPMARDLYELAVRHENPDIKADALHYLADCPLLAGDFAEAEKRYRRALAHARHAGFSAQCPTELIGVAMAAAGQGHHARAVRLAAAAQARRGALGLRRANPSHWWTRLQERHIGGATAALGDVEADKAERAGREAAFDDVLDEVLRTDGQVIRS